MMFGAWGGQELPNFDDIQAFIQSFDDDEQLPGWLPILADELLQLRDNAEVSNCKYRMCSLRWLLHFGILIDQVYIIKIRQQQIGMHIFRTGIKGITRLANSYITKELYRIVSR